MLWFCDTFAKFGSAFGLSLRVGLGEFAQLVGC